jgi:hypothetical protein
MASLEEHDSHEIRCVHLGGQVTFNYCRRLNRGLPCKLIIGCWHGRVDVIAFLREHFTAHELRQALQPEPGTKLERFIELVRRDQAQPPSPGEEENPRQERA